jgi:hypothetical protein
MRGLPVPRGLLWGQVVKVAGVGQGTTLWRGPSKGLRCTMSAATSPKFAATVASHSACPRRAPLRICDVTTAPAATRRAHGG